MRSIFKVLPRHPERRRVPSRIYSSVYLLDLLYTLDTFIFDCFSCHVLMRIILKFALLLCLSFFSLFPTCFIALLFDA